MFGLLCGVMYTFFPHHIDNDDVPLSLSDKPELSDHTMALPVSQLFSKMCRTLDTVGSIGSVYWGGVSWPVQTSPP